MRWRIGADFPHRPSSWPVRLRASSGLTATCAPARNNSSVWQKVRLSGVLDEIEQFKNELGYELIAKRLGIQPLSRHQGG